jgi:hypothetical protein
MSAIAAFLRKNRDGHVVHKLGVRKQGPKLEAKGRNSFPNIKRKNLDNLSSAANCCSNATGLVWIIADFVFWI